MTTSEATTDSSAETTTHAIEAAAPLPAARNQLAIGVLAALSVSHLLNDIIQSLLPAVYPLLKENYALSFFQIGLITFAFQLTASLLQPVVGMVTDRRPWPYSLAVGMTSTLVGLIMLAMADSFGAILL